MTDPTAVPQWSATAEAKKTPLIVKVVGLAISFSMMALAIAGVIDRLAA
jgi:hypothetical protein